LGISDKNYTNLGNLPDKLITTQGSMSTYGHGV